jgi:uncharacterized protein (TIGR03437 family)
MIYKRGILPISANPASSCLWKMKPICLYLLLLFSSFLTNAFAQITLNPLPTRVLGQDSAAVTSINPNLVEGREFYTPSGVALDTSTNPPTLYVSDTGNNRVLGFRSVTSFANGKPADLVLGQANFASTLPQGPGHPLSTGLSSPSGLAVDAQGNVYVVDSGNNRILRFPQPFNQAAPILPDFVIGQTTFASNTSNQGGVSASTLSFTSATTLIQVFITFDPSGNLWVSDAGNNRVLRFNANLLGSPASSGPVADIVLGQSDFVTGTYNPSGNPLLSLSSFSSPSGIAFDAAGRLFVGESLPTSRGRILMWTPPFTTGQGAAGLLGVDTDTPPPAATSALQLGISPGGLFAIGTSIGAVDTANSRILIFPPVEQWLPNATYQAAIEVAGQPDFASSSANRGQATAGPDRFSGPGSAVFFGSELYVADTFNNRVVVMPQNGTLPNASFGGATRVLGQDLLTLNAPNLVEGKEFDFGTSSVDAGITVDLNSNPPHLYVADTYNNRILGFNDLRNLTTGGKADIVIGQPDFQQVLANYPNNSATQTNASGLFLPTGLVVDTAGNLYVADRGNGRVLRFPQPFGNYSPGVMAQADLVLGQSGFSSTEITDATARTMSQPYGLAFTLAGGLLVSDVALNRVLYFAGPSANMKSGMSASTVLGQPDFNSSAAGSGATQMSAPHHISTDTDDRLYVADTGNGRVDIFDHAPTADPGQAAAQFLTNGISSPRGMYVSAATGDIWVADASGGAVRYPAFNQLVAVNGAPNATLPDIFAPLAVVEDAWGDMFLADAVHRVGIYYPGLAPINAANFLNPGVLAPGMISALYSEGNFNQFGGQPSQATALPLPTQLNGVSVLFNGAPVPLFYADANQINFQVPMLAPQSGTADLQVMDLATGRILGDTTVVMTQALPGLFTQAGNGSGAAAALNQDNTLNSQTNPAAQGTVITLFGTGQGFISGAPPDGTVSNAPLQTAYMPEIIMGTGPVPPANVKYAGLAPTLVGVWQINVLIPDTVITTPTNPTQVVAIQNSIASGGGGVNRPVIIYVKQK